ncbi:unnamed protein product [Alopecurus aequalis]
MMLGSKRKGAVPMPSCGSVVSNKRKMAAVSSSALPPLPEEMVEQKSLFTLEHAHGNFVEVVTPAPCRGLTLLYDAVPPAYYICNAATREVTRVPPFLDTNHGSSVGLGYDARTGKYKVVRLISGMHHEKEMIKCEVYTAGGGYGECWRPVTREVPFGMRRFVRLAVANAALLKLAPVFADGFLHWSIPRSSFTRWPRAAVISFSVTEHTFKCARAPPFWALEVHQPTCTAWITGLVEMGNLLCMVRDFPKCNGGTLEIWKLHDYSSGDWSLSHQIDLSGNIARDLFKPPLHLPRVIGSIGNCTSGKKIIIVTTKHMVQDKFQKKVHSYDPGLAPVHKTDREIALSSTLAKATKEILLRLPAKSVIWTKLVCKQWLSLTESESFIQSYLEHKNMDKRPKVMLVGKGTGQSGFSFLPLNSRLGEHHRHIALLDTKIVCSKPCHGLNLVSTEDKDYVYNPCTGFHRVYYNQEHHDFGVGNKNVGLGFNHLIREHFLVEIFYNQKDFGSRRYNLTCLLRWCNSGAYAQIDLVPPLPVNDMPPAYVDGTMYWMSEPRLGQSYERAIISFDIATNAFGVVPFPPCIAMWNSTSHCHAYVVELEGVLCAILADPIVNSLDIWKLKHGQWSRPYIVHLEGWPDYSIGTNVVVPLAVDPDDGRIMLNTGKKLGLYDLVERTIQNLYSLDQGIRCSNNQQSAGELNRMDNEIIPLVPMLYEESLVGYPRVAQARWL